MWPQPDDPVTVERMRTAHRQARTALGVRLGPGAQKVWGWRGRTLSQPVITPGGLAWLRLATAPAGQTAATFWNGSIEAESAIPRSIPRPRLRNWHDWHEESWEYRAELYDYVTTRPAATSPTPTRTPDLPTRWWKALRTTLDQIAAVATSRVTVHQPFLDRAMPRFLNTPIDTVAPGSWATAHGDFHYANLGAPTLHVFDWEGWGLAPAGYDAAVLHSHSLPIPSLAARVRSELTHILDTPDGRYAELVVITQLLHSNTRGDNLDLAEPLRRRAAQLLSSC